MFYASKFEDFWQLKSTCVPGLGWGGGGGTKLGNARILRVWWATTPSSKPVCLFVYNNNINYITHSRVEDEFLFDGASKKITLIAGCHRKEWQIQFWNVQIICRKSSLLPACHRKEIQLNKLNIARGTMDPVYWIRKLNILFLLKLFQISFSQKCDSSYRLNTLGPLCLWQCFTYKQYDKLWSVYLV